MREARLSRRLDFGQFQVDVSGCSHHAQEFRRKFPVSKICSALSVTNLVGFGAGGKLTTSFVVLTSGTSWTVAGTFNKTNNKIEAIAGGASGSRPAQGGAGPNNGAGGAGGGGGAYAVLLNFDPAGATSVSYSIGAGGAQTTGVGQNAGSDTTFNSTSLVAKSTTNNIGGAAASCTPTTGALSGGTGGLGGTSGSTTTAGGGGGGGGGAGSTGAGGAGTAGTAGTGGGGGGPGGSAGTGLLADAASGGGAGGAGGLGGTAGNTGNPGSAGNNYGSGGGGGGGGGKKTSICDPPAGFAGGNGAAGKQGVIVISWSFFA